MKTFCGAASLLTGQYDGGWSFAQIAESLATTRAFNKEYPQFGSLLNKELDGIKNMKRPKGNAASNSAVDHTMKHHK
jgi:hypothetical protein